MIEAFHRDQSTLTKLLKKLSEIKSAPEKSELALIIEGLEEVKSDDNHVEMEVKRLAETIKKSLRTMNSDPAIKSKLKEFATHYQDFHGSRLAVTLGIRSHGISAEDYLTRSIL